MLALLAAGAMALLVAGFGTPILIKWLRRQEIGQHIREDGPASHSVKAGTPTMGGLLIVAAAVVGFTFSELVSPIPIHRSGILVLATVVGFGLIGFLDDAIKVRNKRSLGLNKRAKSGGQLLMGIAFAFAAVYWTHVTTTLSFTRHDFFGWQLGTAGWMVFAVVVLIGSSNAVNLTDGLDGLASGSAAQCFVVLAVIGYWQFRHYNIYKVPDAIDLALVAVALAGGCVGFLWWNAAPARIIMGDTGSLALGSGLAALCLLMNLDLLLVILGGLFVLETLSVIIQVASFKMTGKRVFKMAPIHHHFELLGWPETTVIIRFWIISALCAGLALGIFYGDFVKVTNGL